MIILGLPLVYWLVIFSVLIGIGGAYAYIRDTLLGQSKPNRVSWAMWSLAPLIATAAAIASGADLLATVRIFLAGFLPLLVFLASFLNPRSYWKLTSFDAICGSLSLMAIFVWWGIDSPHLAILLAAAGDGFAAIPTVIKAWKYPETETGLFYIAGFISVILVIPSIPVWNIANSAFQIYLITANALLVLCIYRKYLKIWKN
jgi:hypothetical protein